MAAVEGQNGSVVGGGAEVNRGREGDLRILRVEESVRGGRVHFDGWWMLIGDGGALLTSILEAKEKVSREIRSLWAAQYTDSPHVRVQPSIQTAIVLSRKHFIYIHLACG